MSIASSQVDPAYKIYRRYKDKREDDWDGDIFLDKTLPLHGETEMDDDDQPAPPPPPYIVLVQGPPKVGKSTLIKSLVECLNMGLASDNIRGPITIITGDQRRLQFVECPDEIDGMIDAAKYADLVLFLVDASYGFEAETFEFLNLLQAHGIPSVTGVFTHLDKIKDEKEQHQETIERLRDHFRTEIDQEARVFCFSGPCHNMYISKEVQELADHISMIQSCSSSWRAAHPYLLVDRIEYATPLEKLHKDANCKRNITSLYGYLRGCNIKSGAKVHLAGVGDFRLAGVRSTNDPFPLSSETEKENDFVELTHMENESFRIGTYLRLEIHDVPLEVVKNFDPCHPILIGGIEEEENVGYMQASLQRHHWHMKLLKSADPVTVSAGWRRYQTRPVYASPSNGRHVILDFNLEHEHCIAMFWGPLAPCHTRVAVVHGPKEVFRIAAKAVILDPEAPLKILKEYQLEGKALDIVGKKTAHIKFESKDVEVDKFEGSPIRTQSLIRVVWGKVDEAVTGGIAKCTFQKKIRKSDTFIMSVFRQVGAPRSFKPCNSNKDSFEKRRLRLGGRRHVEITDEEPCSHPDSCYYPLFRNFNSMRSKGKETVVVMSAEKRAELLKKQQIEETKRLMAMGLDW
ncbi:hypothetical protein MKW94_019330 [Papaver nudicaule]|uniref:Bms1-type G domain-containing protein n=1 Tax=Papaver nudicaule TaxID=74823 RepID=A0AA41UY66_PAPNU|nr:hypothetical protein [Papaver nudicaule]